MRTVRRTALGAVAVSVITLVAPVTVAHADSGDTLKGGCTFDDSTQLETSVIGGQHEGVIFDLSVSQEAAGGPSVATVECFIMVHGVEAPGTRITATGNGVQANYAPITFTVGDLDTATLCQQVTFADGSTWAGPDDQNPDCLVEAGPQFPPQFVADTLQAVVTEVDCVINAQICIPFEVNGP